MNIQLKPEQEKLIRDHIASGEYSNADDVISQAFKLLEARDRKIKKLKDKIAISTEQITKGQVTDGEEVFEVVFARLVLNNNEMYLDKS